MRDRTDDLLRLLDVEGPRLHALLNRMTLSEDVAEDLMQELFLKLNRSKAFDRADAPAAYAVRAAVHLAFDWRRRQKRRSESNSIPGDLAADCSSSDELDNRDELEGVLDAMARLPNLQREIVVFHYLHHQSYEVIGGQLGKTAHQVRALCHKAVVQLREFVGRNVPPAAEREVFRDRK